MDLGLVCREKKFTVQITRTLLFCVDAMTESGHHDYGIMIHEVMSLVLFFFVRQERNRYLKLIRVGTTVWNEIRIYVSNRTLLYAVRITGR